MMISNFTGGWRNLKAPARFGVGLLFLLSISSTAVAGEIDKMDSPDMAMIEFLGSWETDEGEWTDPSFFDETPPEEVLRETEQNGKPILGNFGLKNVEQGQKEEGSTRDRTGAERGGKDE